eukprot:TRINITY_DN1213_c0_g1_i1.p1 TRINITY_DN1213_c0_g1~~TRINITY_DN1213_c0_g1_i1.p1  ORF type:complete len:131 (+),score=28.96 TRINITY_DN1213_c0_g1_i1:74-466(+)
MVGLYLEMLFSAAAVAGTLSALLLLLKLLRRAKTVSFADLKTGTVEKASSANKWKRIPTPVVLESWRRLATEDMDANHCAQAMEKGLATEGIKSRFFELCPFSNSARQLSTNSMLSDTWEDMAMQCEQTR